MATTTNYSWSTPDDTSLVKDGAAAIRTLGSSIDTTTKALNPSTTLGDIEYRSSTANTNTRLGIGSTGNVLTVAGGVPTWAAPASGSTYVGVSVYKSGNQSIANATFTAVTFDSETFDTDAFHSTSSNTSRFTVPSGKAGKYLLTGVIAFATGTGTREVAIYKNGAAVNYGVTLPASANPLGTYMPISYVLSLAVADYVEIFVYQNSGGALNVTFPEDATSVQMSYLGA